MSERSPIFLFDANNDEYVSILSGRLQFHTIEPIVKVDGRTASFSPQNILMLQALAQPLGEYVERDIMIERIFNDQVPISKFNSLVSRTRERLWEYLDQDPRNIIISSGGGPKQQPKYALYDTSLYPTNKA